MASGGAMASVLIAMGLLSHLCCAADVAVTLSGSTLPAGTFSELHLDTADGRLTSFTINVTASSHYFLQLAFDASTPPTAFIQSLPYSIVTIPSTQPQNTTREVYIFVDASSFLNVSILSPLASSPSSAPPSSPPLPLSAIVILPAEGLYNLDVTTGTVLVSDFRIDSGAQLPFGPDHVGRFWETDGTFLQRNPNATINVFNATSSLQVEHFVNGTSTEPLWAPLPVYATEVEAVLPANASLIYLFPSTPSTTYYIRLHFAELLHAPPGERVMNVSLNGEVYVTGLDVSRLAGLNQLLYRDLTIAVNSSELEVEISPDFSASLNPSLNYPMVNAVEIFHYLQPHAHVEASSNATSGAPPSNWGAGDSHMPTFVAAGVLFFLIVSFAVYSAFCRSKKVLRHEESGEEMEDKNAPQSSV